MAINTRSKYQGKDNYGNPKSAYLAKIRAMSDGELYRETKDKIWLSAYASNNPRSDNHWQCDATYDEWVYRGKVEEYNKAHKEVSNG